MLAPLFEFGKERLETLALRSLHVRSARLGASTEDKLRCSNATPFHTAGTRPAYMWSAGTNSVKPWRIIGEGKSQVRR